MLNIFKIKNKINKTVEEIIKFNPDILFSVDSPDFTMRVAERVKKINSNIKTIHYVAPQVWIWRKNRVKKIKKFIDHILLLFDFEKKYFDEENINNTFVGHPLIENNEDNKKNIENMIPKNKKIISVFPGSRKSDGILIKLPKKKQDLRMDLPTIGLQTFKDAKKYGLRGVVLQSKKNIFLDKLKCIKFANKNKIFINII